MDEWSFPALLADLSTAYQARATGQEPHWAPLPIQYADYAIWQRHEPIDLGYWQQVLADAPQESTITLDRPRPSNPTHHGWFDY